MAIIREFIKLLKAPFSVDSYYRALNLSLKRINNEYTMLHYPLFVDPEDSFLQSQKNLTDYCISMIGDVKGKIILEVGCGNGIQLLYIHEKYKPSAATGIDLNFANISIANEVMNQKKLEKIRFLVGNAQDLNEIESDSQDFVINIESAFHYPDKQSFLSEIKRVLKPDGKFLVADLLLSKKKNSLTAKFFRKKLGLYHWTRERYLEGFARSNLEILNTTEITSQVIKGFLNYPYWFSQMKMRNSMDRLSNKFFNRFILHLFIYLLRKRRCYVVFMGQKV